MRWISRQPTFEKRWWMVICDCQCLIRHPIFTGKVSEKEMGKNNRLPTQHSNRIKVANSTRYLCLLYYHISSVRLAAVCHHIGKPTTVWPKRTTDHRRDILISMTIYMKKSYISFCELRAQMQIRQSESLKTQLDTDLNVRQILTSYERSGWKQSIATVSILTTTEKE